MENMIGQWRNYLKCTVDEMNEELRQKDLQIKKLNATIERMNKK